MRYKILVVGATMVAAIGTASLTTGAAAEAAPVSAASTGVAETGVRPMYPPPADDGYYDTEVYNGDNQNVCIGLGVGGILTGAWENYWCWQNPSTRLWELWARDY